MIIKLDGVGPVHNRPSPAKLHHLSERKKKEEEKMRHVTHDMWHVTHDTWHMTPDTWRMTHDMFGEVNVPSKFQLPSSYCLWFMIIWRLEEKADLMNQLMNDKAVYRTAPGLLNMIVEVKI